MSKRKGIGLAVVILVLEFFVVAFEAIDRLVTRGPKVWRRLLRWLSPKPMSESPKKQPRRKKHAS